MLKLAVFLSSFQRFIPPAPGAFALLLWALLSCGNVLLHQKCSGFQCKGRIYCFPPDEICVFSMANDKSMDAEQSRNLYILPHPQRAWGISICLGGWQNILKGEGSTSCQWVENKEYENLYNTYPTFRTISLKIQTYFQNFIHIYS